MLLLKTLRFTYHISKLLTVKIRLKLRVLGRENRSGLRLKEGRRLLGSKLYLMGLEIQISSSHGIEFGIPSGDESTPEFWSGVDSWVKVDS